MSSKPEPIAVRIARVLLAKRAAGEFTVHFVDLEREVFPFEHFPRAANYSSNGGPPGCRMALSKAIRRYGFFETWHKIGQRLVSTNIPPAVRSMVEAANRKRERRHG
jgi:hypothetical protein